MPTSSRRAIRRRSARVQADRVTKRQVEVVAAYLSCDSEQAAACRLGRSVRTVERHLANARSRTGAPTTAHLVWILATRIEDLDA